MSTVLVTGGTGFLAGHIIIQLLNTGYDVRTTVRSLQRADVVRANLYQGGIVPDSELQFLTGDLLQDKGWSEAVSGCDAVLHVASPFPPVQPKNEDELVAPAVGGTLRVLKAAHAAGVKRVVLTSSFAAVGYGHGTGERHYNEGDWTDPAGADVTPYIKSKTLAERAAWDFISNEGRDLEFSVINPVGIFGPVLGPDYAASIGLVRALLKGSIPALPRIYFGAVDVRDVAALHLLALTSPAAIGERFIAVAEPIISMAEIAKVLREHFGSEAGKVPRRTLPDWLYRTLAQVVPALRGTASQVGIIRHTNHDKAKQLLGWEPRPAREAIIASAESLLRLKLMN